MAKLALRPLPAKRLREAVALLRLEWEETQRLEKAQRKLANDPRRKVGLNGPAIGHAVQPWLSRNRSHVMQLRKARPRSQTMPTVETDAGKGLANCA